MSRKIEIERKVARYEGNKAIFSRIRQGAYQLHTGDVDANPRRTSMGSDNFKKEVDEFLDMVDKEEGLNLSQIERNKSSRELRDQISEGREKLTLRFHDKGVLNK